MAGKTKSMSQIKQLLLLKKQNVSNRKAALQVGMDKETVNNYVRKANADPLGIDGLLKLDDPVLEHRLKGGNAAYPDERFEQFKALLPYLEEEMGKSRKTHVTLKLLWEEYRRDHPDGYSLTQFRYHYRQNTVASKEKKASTILTDLYVGGEKAFLDYAGDTLGYIDKETGEIVKVQTFVASLPASDYGYMLCVPSQRTEDFVYAIAQFLKHIGGVPKILVPDNLKAAIVKTDRYEPTINKMLEDMANHYGCFIQPARPLHPKDKSLVEDHVKLVYQRVYAELRNLVFYSIEDLNRTAAEKMKAHNQKRMQQHPYTREERFLAVDRPNLLPLPAEDFEIRCYTDMKVTPNCCIYLGRDKHYYSVPYQLIGKQVHVEYTRSLVKVYSDGQLVATHQRDYTHGKYTIVNEHLASNSLEYRNRTPERYIERCEQALPELGLLVRMMFVTSRMPPEMHYKSCDGLLSMQRSTDPILFRTACQTAIELQRYNYKFVRQLIDSKCIGVGLSESQCPPDHANIRGKKQFL